MSKEANGRRFQFSLRTMFWCVLAVAVVVSLCSGGFERIFFPTTVYSKDSFTAEEAATLTAPLEVALPINSRIALASYDKQFGPGGGRVTVCLKMPADEAGSFQNALKSVGGYFGTVYLPLGCRLPEWREARKTIETAYIIQFYVYFSKPIDGEVSVYYEFEDYDGRCCKILSRGKWRWALPRERSN